MKVSVVEDQDMTYLVKDFGKKHKEMEIKSNRVSEVRYQDLCVDPVTCRAWRYEREINLSEKEARMLEYFMLHPNQVLTRDMIADYVWGADLKKDSNIVDVYINYLRKKVDFRSDSKLIHTVFRKGYVLRNGAAISD
jgi:DNA-binding response OmpR family regulator